jgi:hypothetical protein
MTYVRINSGNLSGLGGPPRAAGGGNGMFTQWGPNGIFGRGAGKMQLGYVGEKSSPYGAHGDGRAHSARGASLWGLGDAAADTITPAFASQARDAQVALQALAALAQTIKLATTDVAIKAAADSAYTFATVAGPRRVQEALTTGSPAPIASVQGSTQRIIAALKPEVVPAVLQRWMTSIVLGPAGLVAPASLIDAAKEEGRQAGDNIVLPSLEKTKSMSDVVLVVGVLFGVGYLLRAFR